MPVSETISSKLSLEITGMLLEVLHGIGETVAREFDELYTWWTPTCALYNIKLTLTIRDSSSEGTEFREIKDNIPIRFII
jgi:hypothetical protein